MPELPPAGPLHLPPAPLPHISQKFDHSSYIYQMLAFERCLGWAPVTRQALLSPPAQCTPMFLGPKIAPSSFSPSLLSPPIGVPNACILPFREVVWQWQLLSWHFPISYPWRVNRGVFGMQEVVCQVGRQGGTKHFCPKPHGESFSLRVKQ